MVETRTITTAEELLRLPDGVKGYELVKGELRERVPAGARHGGVVMALATPLAQHVKTGRRGIVLAAETGFRIS